MGGFRFLIVSSVAVVVVVDVVMADVVVAVEVVVDIALVTVDNLQDTANNSTHSHEMNSFFKDFVEKVLLVKSTKTSHVAHLKFGRYINLGQLIKSLICVTFKR